MQRGEIWWAELPPPKASEPGYRRPVLIIQANDFIRSCIKTVTVIGITSNTKLAHAPGNIFLDSTQTGLPKDSVINVSQIITIDKSFLTEHVGTLKPKIVKSIEEGLKLALAL
jgi:mRNA interferase MazF